MKMEETIKMICITCPVGCRLEVIHEGPNVKKVTGNECERGIDFVIIELTDPRRMFATTVRVKGGIHPLVPVYTAKPVPKGMIFNIVKELRKIELEAPVHIRQVVLKDALGTGIDIIASRNLPKKDTLEAKV
jgi:CxxC motif-containing protein